MLRCHGGGGTSASWANGASLGQGRKKEPLVAPAMRFHATVALVISFLSLQVPCSPMQSHPSLIQSRPVPPGPISRLSFPKQTAKQTHQPTSLAMYTATPSQPQPRHRGPDGAKQHGNLPRRRRPDTDRDRGQRRRRLAFRDPTHTLVTPALLMQHSQAHQLH